MLRDLVADAVERRHKLKKELARDCRMAPDRLSHLEAGRRTPKREEVLALSKGLGLDEATSGRLLEAAGFAAPRPSLPSVLERLGPVEHALAKAEMDHDHALIDRAWSHYVDSQVRNQARDWADASQRHQDGIELYWQLRAMAEGFLSQVLLAVSAADPHLNRMAQAEARCEEGLEAAARAGSRRLEVMLLVRLASIKRLRSDYQGAGELYERAMGVLDAWAAAEDHRNAAEKEAWRIHWQARILRMQGILELFQGHPRQALPMLDASRAHFERTEAWEELAQVCYALGWADGLRGDLEKAVSWDLRGLELTERGNRASGRQDDRSLLQGHLYLGGHYLDLDDLVKAREHLQRAHALARQPRLSQYHEVGRVDLLLGRLAMWERQPDLARQHLRAALDFFSGQQEQMLLATAHNVMGDFHQSQGGPHLQRALDHYSTALAAARRSRPPNTYYECAALLNICRVCVRAGRPTAEPASRRDGPAGREQEWDVDAMIAHARELSRTHRYSNHGARLAVLEAEWALKRGDPAAARNAAGTALHASHNFSVRLHDEVRAELRTLGLPDSIADVPATDVG